MTPPEGFSEKVRARIKELTGNDSGPFKVRDIFPGTDPDATDEQRVEAIAKSMAEVLSGKAELVEFDDDDQPVSINVPST